MFKIYLLKLYHILDVAQDMNRLHVLLALVSSLLTAYAENVRPIIGTFYLVIIVHNFFCVDARQCLNMIRHTFV